MKFFPKKPSNPQPNQNKNKKILSWNFFKKQPKLDNDKKSIQWALWMCIGGFLALVALVVVVLLFGWQK